MESGEYGVADKLIALRYMTRFRCLGARCEDHCCRDWNVFLDEASYQRLHIATSQSSELRQKLENGLVRTATKGSFATLRAGSDGNCAFLEEGLCALHRDLGEASLPGTCATYPRSVAHIGSRCELSGSLSCPEVARLCLCEPDAMEWSQVDWEILPETCLVTRQVAPGDGDYSRFFDQVRDAVSQLLSSPDYPLEDRLFFVAHLASRLGPVFHRNAGADACTTLEASLARMRDPLWLAELSRQFRGLDVSTPVALRIVLETVRWSLREQGRVRYRALCSQVSRTYGLELSELLNESERISDEYARRREMAQKRFGHRLNQYFSNYALNYWFREPYTQSADLLAHTRSLVVRIAMIKFLLFNHPDLRAHLENDMSDTDALDRIAVEVVQTFERNVGHDTELRERIQTRLTSEDASDLPQLICLIGL